MSIGIHVKADSVAAALTPIAVVDRLALVTEDGQVFAITPNAFGGLHVHTVDGELAVVIGDTDKELDLIEVSPSMPMDKREVN